MAHEELSAADERQTSLSMVAWRLMMDWSWMAWPGPYSLYCVGYSGGLLKNGTGSEQRIRILGKNGDVSVPVPIFQHAVGRLPPIGSQFPTQVRRARPRLSEKNR
jgi:hypothetical protein